MLEHKRSVAVSTKLHGKAAKHFLSPLHQTSSHLIAFLFAAYACTSKVSLPAGQGVYLKYTLALHMVPII